MSRLPTYFVSHGGGPWPWMKDVYGNMFDQLEASLRAISPSLKEDPKAILMISAHWEEAEFTLSSAQNPSMYYDYSGFPPHTYKINYPAPGSPQLAIDIQQLLTHNGIRANLNPDRGFDHGTFTVMAPAFPEADIPIVQLSLQKDFDPTTHIELGRILTPLRDEGVLIIGSGYSYHNLRMYNEKGAIPSKMFDVWLQETLITDSFKNRENRLKDWVNAPAARLAHPREEHLLPLMVAAGAALNDPCTCIYHEETIFGCITASSFRFDAVV